MNEHERTAFALRKALCRVIALGVHAIENVFDQDLLDWWESNKTEEDEQHLRLHCRLDGRNYEREMSELFAFRKNKPPEDVE